MDKNAHVPDAEFYFTIEKRTYVPAKSESNQDEILVGIGNPVITPKDNSNNAVADFDPTDNTYDSVLSGDNLKLSDNQKYAVKEMTIDFSNVAFEDPGIYRYIIKESGTNDGVTNDETTTRTLDVYVISDKDNNLTIDGYVLYKTAVINGVSTVVKGEFTNTYATKDITVAKTVTGNQGDRNKDFKFTISITNADPNKEYDVVKGNSTKTITAGANGTVTCEVELKDKETVTIYGLTDATKYTVTETSYASNGYTTKWQDTAIDAYDTKKATEANKTSDLTVKTTQNVTFENNKQVATPTGILMSIAPYVLMVAIEAVIAVMFLRKRRNAEF